MRATLQGNVSILKQKDQRQLTDVSSVKSICVFYVFPCTLNVLGSVPSIVRRNVIQRFLLTFRGNSESLHGLSHGRKRIDVIAVFFLNIDKRRDARLANAYRD